MLKGERLDRPTYSFLHTIEDGNTAICHLTRHEIFGCPVVQKTVSMLGLQDAAAANEPELLKRIRHPRVVEVWEAQWDPAPEWKSLNAVTFTTPYYEGESIYRALMDGHVFGVGDTMRIGAQVLDALDHMHASHGLLHRDVKPANILLDAARKNAFLGDLGSAAYIQTATGGADAHAGSALYLAPEARPEGLVTVRSDLYSLGVTLVEMLHGRFPYEDLDPNEIDGRLDQGKRALRDRLLVLAPWIPKPYATFLRSLSNQDPAKRPESAAAALRTLNDLKVVDWNRSEGEGLTGTWIGTWPPERERGQRRTHEITIEKIARGRNAGSLKATARWHDPDRRWRNYAKLTKTFDADPAEVGRYFRRVDSEAQSAPAK